MPMKPVQNPPDTFVVVVRWARGVEEFCDVVSCDVTLDPGPSKCLIVQIVYINGSSERFPKDGEEPPLGVKVRNM